MPGANQTNRRACSDSSIREGIETVVPPKISVEIADRQRSLPIPRLLLRRLIKDVLSAENIAAAHIELAFVDDATIHRVNRDHLKHDYPTDVITFPYSTPGERLEGELVISTDHAIANAASFGHSAERELFLYVIHGLLHLVGYDDHDPAKKKKMHRRQIELLDQFGPVAKMKATKPKSKSAPQSSPTVKAKKGRSSSRRTS